MLRLVADKFEFTLASTFYDDESNQMYPLLSHHVWYKLYDFMNRNVAQIYICHFIILVFRIMKGYLTCAQISSNCVDKIMFILFILQWCTLDLERKEF